MKMTKKKAFTLIELLIVIAIIGILFIVLVSKVDFATDKAKATGVQTDFRSFQMAFDTVAKENAGFNTFGWDTGDANQDGVRNSYDEGDNGAGGGTAKNGIQDGSEVFTGHKVYAETFTKVYSLKKNGTGSYDRDALNRLETAINANLDPKLHITIKDDGGIVMANGAQDPWKTEYHGYYITNAEVDGKDRGAIIMYSNGANQEFGSEHSIANGVVTITVPGNNKDGKDDMSIVSCYTYVNGYGEVKNMTTGFSVNHESMDFGANNTVTVLTQYEFLSQSDYNGNDPLWPLYFKVDADYSKFSSIQIDGVDVDASKYTITEGSTIVNISSSYIQTLSVGNHSIEIFFNDGVAKTTFNVTATTCTHDDHTDMEYNGKYTDTHHAVEEFCNICYQQFAIRIEPHTDTDADGNCDWYCGYHVHTTWYCGQCGYCEHQEVNWWYDEYVYNENDNTHSVKGFCDYCGTAVYDTPESCDYSSAVYQGDGTHLAKCSICSHIKDNAQPENCDINGFDKRCSICNNCAHLIEDAHWVVEANSNHDGTHTAYVRCEVCYGDGWYEYRQQCTYGSNGLCIYCHHDGV